MPLRLRLVLGFAAAMLIVLAGAGAFVYWRVSYALDARLTDDLNTAASDLQRAASLNADPVAAVASLGGQGRDAELLDAGGRVLVAGTGLTGRGPLLTPAEVVQANSLPLRLERGSLLSRNGHLRVLALPVRSAAATPVAVAVAAVRLDERDEALRELLGQLAVANLMALAVASLVGYRLARAALQPVERYRTRAEQIAGGATGVRLDVPPGADDEISRLGRTLNAMLAAQEAAAQRQQQFVDDASHELRTPLTVLTAELELALRRPRTALELEETLRRIATDTSRLVELADDLLTLGSQGAMVPKLQALAVHDVLGAAAARARAALDPDVGRRVCVDGPADLVTYADPALLHRALGNLVDNAVRYGAGAITLTARPLPGRPTVGTLLAVSDEGPGMSSEFLPHAAERFRQAQKSRAGVGNGLGLSLVDSIVTAHAGQLRICSNGSHHCRPTPDPRLDAQPCWHPAAGTTSSLLLPARR